MAVEHEAARWLEFAREDLAYGSFGLERFPRAAAWSFQQAGEKALKAGLIAVGQVPPRTHDLILLLNLLDPNAPKSVREAVIDLAEITTAVRYPDDEMDTVDVALARQYEAATRVVIADATRRLGGI